MPSAARAARSPRSASSFGTSSRWNRSKFRRSNTPTHRWSALLIWSVLHRLPGILADVVDLVIGHALGLLVGVVGSLAVRLLDLRVVLRDELLGLAEEDHQPIIRRDSRSVPPARATAMVAPAGS